MLLDAPQPLGRLVLRSVYFEHDGPRLFSASRPDDDSTYVATCVDETEDEIRFVFWAVSNDDLRNLERGSLTLRDSLAQSEQIVLTIEDYSGATPTVTVTPTSLDAVPLEYLPDPGAALTDLRAPATRVLAVSPPPPLEDAAVAPEAAPSQVPIRPPDTPHRFLNPFSIDELNRAAYDDRHFYAAVEVQGRSERLEGEGALNLSTLSMISGAVQELVYALGNESQGFQRTGETVRSALDLSVQGAMAASFVLVLRTPEQGMLFDGELTARALRGLTWILKSARYQDELISELEGRSYQVRRRVRDLLTAVTESDAGITALVTDGQDVTWGKLTPMQAVDALSAIASVPPSLTTVEMRGVLLTALNLTRRTFEVWDRASGRKYSGALDEGALEGVGGLTVSESEQLYDVLLEVETDFAQDRYGPARRIRLLSISPTGSSSAGRSTP